MTFAESDFRGLAVEKDQAPRALKLYSGLCTHAEVEAWLSDAPVDPLYQQLVADPELGGLSGLDFAILLAALAPEFDPDYERLFGYLQDDVTRRRASVELIVKLFAPTPAERPAVLARFAQDSPLLSARLVEFVEPGDGRPGVLGAGVRADAQFTRWLLDIPGTDPRLAGVARLAERHTVTPPPGGVVPAEVHRTLAALFSGRDAPPVRLYLHGPDRRLQSVVGESLAARLGRQRLVIDPVRFAASPSTFEAARLLAREGRWFARVLSVERVEGFQLPERQAAWADLTSALTGPAAPPYFIVCGTRPTLPPMAAPVGFSAVELPAPGPDERVAVWTAAAKRVRGQVCGEEVRDLADRYALTWSQIESAAEAAAARARLRAKGRPGEPTADDFAAAARTEGGHDLEALTHKISPRVRLDDVIVTAEVRAQLDEVVGRVTNRAWVLDKWGFGRGPSHGHGVNALFAGPSGTGKTMAAEAVAAAIRKDLYKIDLTSVVSKYIGETEQKLEQIFLAGEATQAVLFFDEADSLLGKRSEVKDAHDRYANLEVSYLLQRMERYDGLIILATNLLGNLDEAFLRRMSAIVHFPPPGPAERVRLWERVWPATAPVLGRVWPPAALYDLGDEDRTDYAVDPGVLGERFELTGGNIRNAALAAAFAAAARPWFPFISMADALQGVRREYQKLGQAASDADLGLDEYAAPPPRPGLPEASAAVEADALGVAP